MVSRMDISTLVSKIISDIQAGKLMDEQRKLPTEPNLMECYQVTRYTLRQALKQLSTSGYVYQVHGVGTFVRPQQSRELVALEHNGGLSKEMARIGRKLTTTEAHQRVIPVSQAKFFPESWSFKKDDQLIELQRFRELDGKPYLLEHSYYLKSVIKDIPKKALYSSLFQYFEKQRQTQIGFIDQTIMSEPLPTEAVKFMKLPEGAPSLVVQDESYLNNGQLLAFSKQYYNYKMSKLFMVKKIH